MEVAAILTFIVIGWIGIGRNHLVYKMRQRRIAEVHDYNIARVAAGKVGDIAEHDRLMKLYDDIMDENYFAQIFDLSKWTYRQFYPTPVEQL